MKPLANTRRYKRGCFRTARGADMKVALLSEFCERLERTPQMIEGASKLVQEGQFKLRERRASLRRADRRVRGGMDGRRPGNGVRSFFIHTAIPIPAAIIK